MKISAYGIDKNSPVLSLRLMDADDIHAGVKYGGGAMLVAVDDNGNRITDGNILRITPGGRIERRPYVNPGLGLDLDEYGRVRLAEVVAW
jgi:hypothetical protein